VNDGAANGDGEKSRMRRRVEAEEADGEDGSYKGAVVSVHRPDVRGRGRSAPTKSRNDAKTAGAILVAVLLSLSPFTPFGQTSTRT
jgi:hypothetical protein